MKEADALSYLNILGADREIKVLDFNNKWATKKYCDMFNDIYRSKNIVYLTPDGYVHY